MPGHHVVVVGFSRGGVETVARLAARRPRELPAPVSLLYHCPAKSASALVSLFSPAGRLPGTGLERRAQSYAGGQ